MADISSLLLPDINLMQGYEQSFQRQQALKQYIVQKSDKDEEKYYKDNTFGLDDALGAVRGQQQAMIGKQNEYMAKVQKAYADMKHGAMFRLDPKKSAELQMERVKLEADQSQRLMAIKKLNTAAVTINKPGSGLLYDPKSFEDYKKTIQSGGLPSDDMEPLVERPPDIRKLSGEILSQQFKPNTDYENTIRQNNLGNTKQTLSFNKGLNAGSDVLTDDTGYNKNGYQVGMNTLFGDPKWQYSAQVGYNDAVKNDPSVYDQFKQYGKDAYLHWGGAQSDQVIKDNMYAKSKTHTTLYKEGDPEVAAMRRDREDAKREKMTLPAIDPLTQVYSVPPRTTVVGANIGKGKKVNALVESIDRKNKKLNITYFGDDGKTQEHGQASGDDYIKVTNELHRLGYGFDEGINIGSTQKSQPQPPHKPPTGKYPQGVDVNGNGKEADGTVWKNGKMTYKNG